MLILKLIGDTSVLAVLAAPECDLGLVSYETALLGEQAYRILVPEAGPRAPAARSGQRPAAV